MADAGTREQQASADTSQQLVAAELKVLPEGRGVQGMKDACYCSTLVSQGVQQPVMLVAIGVQHEGMHA
jgi:hypothetical protein